MGFPYGPISFRRFAVVGKSILFGGSIDQAMLDSLAEHALKQQELGVPKETEYGWSGGRHVLDGEFSFEANVLSETIHFALRIDTNKVPAELKKAWLMQNESAAAKANPSGFISKNQKREAREAVRRMVDEQLRSGAYRRSKLLPILWDVPSQTLLCAARGRPFEFLYEIFERTFGLELQPMTSGSLGMRILAPALKMREYEDLRPTRFVIGPEGETQVPDYPWVAKGA